jgi:hypothetical protein
MIKSFLSMFFVWLMLQQSAEAKLIVQTGEARRMGDKVIVKLALKNTFSEKIESVRATLFLMDDKDKVVGQKTEWVIGGSKEKPSLAPGTSTSYNFVLPSQKSFTKTRFVFNRIILDGGKQVDPNTGSEIIAVSSASDSGIESSVVFIDDAQQCFDDFGSWQPHDSVKRDIARGTFYMDCAV